MDLARAQATEVLHDLLTMLGVDPDERPEHGGPTTAEVLARAVLSVVCYDDLVRENEELRMRIRLLGAERRR